MRTILASLLFLLLCEQATAQNLQPMRIRVNGVELHFIERGRGEPLILLHGGTGDYRSWGPQMETFSRDYRVISYSRRYNYPNQNPLTARNHSAEVEAEDLAAFLRRLNIRRAHLVGTSYGAFTALALALKHPEMVRSLVLAEPPVHQWVRDMSGGEVVYLEFMTNVWRPAAEAFRRGDARQAMRVLADGIWGRPIFDSLPLEGVAAIMQNARSMEALTLSSDPFPSLPKDRVRQLNVPALIVTGEHAIRIHRLVNEELARLLPEAERAIIPQAGHGSPRENPQAFNQAVLRFLANHRP
jgi:pimeloyl-ACP methyl ester carboxylesterase